MYFLFVFLVFLFTFEKLAELFLSDRADIFRRPFERIMIERPTHICWNFFFLFSSLGIHHFYESLAIGKKTDVYEYLHEWVGTGYTYRVSVCVWAAADRKFQSHPLTISTQFRIRLMIHIRPLRWHRGSAFSKFATIVLSWPSERISGCVRVYVILFGVCCHASPGMIELKQDEKQSETESKFHSPA